MAGSQGVISAAWQGQLGPPLPSPLRFGVLLCVWEHRWGGIFVVPELPSPFGARERRKERNHVGACKEDTPCLSPSRRSSKPLCPLPRRCAPSRAHLYLLTRPPGISPFGSCWICCCQFPGMVRRARTCGCCYGEKTKPGILLPRGENRKEKRKAGFAECLKHKMTLLSRGAWTSVSGCYYQLEQNVAFHFSGIKRKPLQLYWNKTVFG